MAAQPAAEQAHEFRQHPHMTIEFCVADPRPKEQMNDFTVLCGQPRSAAIHRLVTDAPAEHDCAKYGHPPHEPGMCPEGERFTCTCGEAQRKAAQRKAAQREVSEPQADL